jgi:hypothetical protein
MVVNFRARGISRGERKLIQTPTLHSKKKKQNNGKSNASFGHFCLLSLSIILPSLPLIVIDAEH